MEETVIVTFSNVWGMVDEATGQKREGLTIEYHLSEDMKPANNEDGSKGYRCAKQSLPLSQAIQVKEVPGIYKLHYGMKIQKGKPVLTAESISFVSPVKLVK